MVTKKSDPSKISNLLLQLVRVAHLHMAKEGEIEHYPMTDTESSSSCEFFEELLIDNTMCTESDRGNVLYVVFDAVGELADLFDKHNLELEFDVSLLNSNFSKSVIVDENFDVEKGIFECEFFHQNKRVEEMTSKEIDAVCKDLEKLLVMYFLKFR